MRQKRASGARRITMGLAALALGSAAAGEPARSQMLDEIASEELVSQLWFEGLPLEEAAQIGPDGAARLAEMLDNPSQRRYHGNILLALGECGQPGAFEAIEQWAALPRAGEVDRSTFQAWQALPLALGSLARKDARALDPLVEMLEEPAPNWHFRHHRGARLFNQARRAAAHSLAMTGLPEVAPVLDRLRQSISDPSFETHLEAMRTLHSKRAREVSE